MLEKLEGKSVEKEEEGEPRENLDGEAASKKYRLQGDQLIIAQAESVDNGHFSCILMKKSTAEFLETSSAELVVRNCSLTPCQNGGKCVETLEGDGH